MMTLLIFPPFWKMRLHEDCNLQDAFEFVFILGICFFLKYQMPKIIIVSKGQMLTNAINNCPSQNHPLAKAIFAWSMKPGFFSTSAFADALSTWKKVKLIVLIADSWLNVLMRPFTNSISSWISLISF